MDRLDVLKLWARHYFELNGEEDGDGDGEDIDPKARGQKFLEIPFTQLGTAQLEGPGTLRYSVDGKVLSEVVSLEDDERWGPVLGASVTPLRAARSAAFARRKPGKLIRVDQLVMREGVRRELGMWEHWVGMMVWGWHDPLGRRLPLWTEAELLRMRKGLLPKVVAESSKLEDVVEDGGDDD